MSRIRRSEKPIRLVFVEIILPALIAANLLAGVLFFVVMPQLEDALMEERRGLISELTQTVVSLVAEYAKKVTRGELHTGEAMAQAREAVRHLRYGPEGKDYFWITDSSPRMIMHPYLPNLEGQDLKQFTDGNGNRLFVDMTRKALDQGRGYADYLWQWKDDASRVTPKLSYVELFKPWDWVIGTGVYVDDVRDEVRGLTRRLALICLGITVVIVAILAFITVRSLRIARQREHFALGLKQSRERYKTLLESTTEGVMLVFSDKLGRQHISYANQTLQRLLGYSLHELSALEFDQLFAHAAPDESNDVESDDETDDINLGFSYFNDFVAGFDTPGQFEAVLVAKDGSPVDAALICSRMETPEGVSGVSVIVKDMRQHKELAERFEAGRRRFDFLAGVAAVGVFRASAGRKGRFLEANDEAARLLGLENADDVIALEMDSLLVPVVRTGSIVNSILSQGDTVEMRVKTPQLDVAGEASSTRSRERIVNLMATVVRDARGFPMYIDGILQDVTRKVQAETAMKQLVAELQSAGEYLTQPIASLARPAPLLSPNASMQHAAKAMEDSRASAVLVGTAGGIEGIVTERDIAIQGAAVDWEPSVSLSRIMNTPVLEIAPTAMAAEALVALRNNAVHHLVVTQTVSDDDQAPRIVEAGELLSKQTDSVSMLLWRLRHADTVDDVVQARAALPLLVQTMVENGADPRLASRIFATVSDAVAHKLTELAVQRLGPPPGNFCFFSMGSQGRLEQTLKTDQDNALVWEDSVPSEAAAYFESLGGMVCDDLHDAGYALCTGGIMAKNAQWRGPLSSWKKQFSAWVYDADPEALLRTKIFFDFRATYGDARLIEAFSTHLDSMLDGKAVFFNLLAKNCLLTRPPLGFFGQFLRESTGEHANAFNIKKAMTPIVDFARIYALKHRIRSANTMQRLKGIHEAGALNTQDYNEIADAYTTLMGLRLTHQARAMRQGLTPNNFIDPAVLTNLERTMLKEIFRQVGALQKKLGLDFTGLM
ncbi:DUF294 nucleotidyltransferase-like domain-containing protein [Desulfovibrio inopinatus]|uniref:DUF294 nucleotidyltransferase-like domain-containing protein n=1 Tax=Desulfovibrio inopinatus TaxID=102109 RepID=UPI0004197D51|nr:DUF294 nucleotidyltransferase-like domain-containing protein [Desulfovibrio inopinatus]